MADFTIEIAGHTAAVHSLFDSTKDYCRAYWSEKTPEFSISITQEDLRYEQRMADEEAVEEGFRFRVFTDPFLDRAAIQRKLADHLLPQGVLMLHGSAIAVDGKGYLFTAKSGTGKSTHTRLWREAFGSRAVMINDDKPFLQIGEEILICGAPWSGKHGLHSNITVPLCGICILERGKENSISPITPEEAMPMLLHQSHGAPEQAETLTNLVNHLAMRTSLWRMACTIDPQAAQIAHTAMCGKGNDILNEEASL